MQQARETTLQQIGMEQAPPVARRRLNRAGRATAASIAEPTTLSQRMVHRRLALGLTQAHVSTKVRIQSKRGHRVGERALSRNGYAMYETGKSEPKLELIEQIASALGVSAGWLAFGEKDGIAITGDAVAGQTLPVSINLTVTGFALRVPEAEEPTNK